MKITKKKFLFLIGKLSIVFILFGFWIGLFIDFEVAVNNEKVTLWCHAPSVIEVDEDFEIVIEAWDSFERVAGSYAGKVSFNIESYNYTTLESLSAVSVLPENYTFTTNYIWGGIFPAYKFTGADNGRKSFQMNITTPGIHYIKIIESNGNSYRSNPIIVKPIGTIKNRLYWGDIHGHTMYSDGSGLPAEAYEFARDVACLDYAALTDHSENFLRIGDIDIFNIFQNYIDITNSYNNEEKFITLVALEWTPKYVVLGGDVSYGHINVYFKGNTMPFFSTLTQRTPYELYDHISKTTTDFIAWSHHTLKTQFLSDFAFYNESINRMIEIYSVHGCCECTGTDNIFPQADGIDGIDDYGYSIRDALRMGRKFGIMSSSDTHDGRLGHPISHTEARCFNQYPYTLSGYRVNHPYPGGLTGLYTPSLNRSLIYDALNNRSGYASTWIKRPYLEFRINGLSVGENDSTVYVENKTIERHIEILACADGVSMRPNYNSNISKINIYKNSELWKTFENISEPCFYRNNITDDKNITGTNYTHFIQKADGYYINEKSLLPVNRSEMNTDGADYYYVRIQDSNSGVSWIGPIWVEPKN